MGVGTFHLYSSFQKTIHFNVQFRRYLGKKNRKLLETKITLIYKTCPNSSESRKQCFQPWIANKRGTEHPIEVNYTRLALSPWKYSNEDRIEIYCLYFWCISKDQKYCTHLFPLFKHLRKVGDLITFTYMVSHFKDLTVTIYRHNPVWRKMTECMQTNKAKPKN